MKTQWLLLSALALTSAVQAEDDYFSVGPSLLRASGDNQYGAGFSAAKINEGKEWGVIGSFDYTRKNDASVYDLMVGPVFQPENKPWLRVYPLIGFGYFYLNGDVTLDGTDYIGRHYDRPGFAYGAGIQVSIPDSRVYVELNYKKLELPNELSDFNFDVTYLGVGCNF